MSTKQDSKTNTVRGETLSRNQNQSVKLVGWVQRQSWQKSRRMSNQRQKDETESVLGGSRSALVVSQMRSLQLRGRWCRMMMLAQHQQQQQQKHCRQGKRQAGFACSWAERQAARAPAKHGVRYAQVSLMMMWMMADRRRIAWPWPRRQYSRHHSTCTS